MNVPSELLFRYDYDKAGRLCVAECSSDGKILENCSLGLGKPLTYDLNGNFLQVDEETYTYHQGSDFVKNTDGSTRSDYLKDANGATVSAFPRGVKEIVRDLLTGKPSCFKLTDGKELQIVYDDKERRAYKKNSSYIRFYGRDMEGNVLSEMERYSDISSWQDYLYSPNGLFSVRTKGLLYPIWKDHLKSPQIICTPEGNVKDCFQYDVFGALIHGDEVKAKNTYDLIRYLFNGYEIDEETGLYDAGARIYDPHLRLFYSKDPRAEYASPYLFLGANPITFADPNGESSWWSILIGAIVGGIVTVATGGIGAVVFGTDIAVSTAVGAVAGVAGSLVGDGVTAGISHEPFSAKRALLDSVTGLAGGAIGAGIGGMTGKIAMRQAFNAGKSCGYVTKIGTTTSMITGGVSGAVASSGVAAAMTGQSFFSKETALNVAIGAIAGAGGALMACGAHFGWFGKVMPVEADLGDIASFNCRIDQSIQGDNLLMTIVDDNSYNQTRSAYGSVDQIFDTAGGIGLTDVVALHGVGRFVFPFCKNGNYMRPMSAKNFGHLIDSVFKNRTSPLKLSICFAALPGPFGSVGHTVHSVLNRPVYAGLGVVDPTTLNTRSSWIKF